jgi:hypothetical protein
MGSVWLRKIVRIKDEVGGPKDGWFGEYMERKVGDEMDTFSGLIPGWARFHCVRGLRVCSIWRQLGRVKRKILSGRY